MSTAPIVLARRDPRHPEAYWAIRRHYLGGSDLAALVRGRLWQVWLDKTAGTALPATEAMDWGTRLEAVVARAVADRHPLWRIRQRHALLGHPTIPWLAASVDRLIYGPDGGPWVLEIKTTGQDWQGQVPEAYQAQVQAYLAVTGAPRAVLAVLVRGQHLEEYELAPDPTLQSALVALGDAFWTRVQRQEPPPLDASEAARAWLLARYPRADDALWAPPTDAVRQAAAAYTRCTQALQALEAERDQLAATLKAAIGPARGVADDQVRVTWVRYDRDHIDWAAIRRDHPDWIAPYTTRKPHDAGLRVTWTKEATDAPVESDGH